MMFLLGMFVGALIPILIGTMLTRITPKELESTKKMLKDVELMGSVKYRFSKVTEITDQQLNLISQAERPSASAAHSRHKNDIIGRLKALEEEKIEIFRSILKDGVDPKLQIMVEGKLQTIRMSEAVAMHDGTQPYPVSETEPMKPRNNGLRLVTTSEDINVSQPNHPEVPSPRS